MPYMRLDRFLSGQGVCSRKEAGAYVRKGLVKVNGVAAASASVKVDTDTDTVSLPSGAVGFEEHVYYMMNKPGGVVSASSDPNERTVIDLLPEEMVRPGLFPAGRLDKDTEGFLLITDDGDFAHRMLAPKKHVEKRYFVKTHAPVPSSLCGVFREGVILEDGYRCLPARLELFPSAPDEAIVAVREGKYHQIKRMFLSMGNEVLYLRRISIGGLELDPKLEPGKCKRLKTDEITKIFE